MLSGYFEHAEQQIPQMSYSSVRDTRILLRFSVACHISGRHRAQRAPARPAPPPTCSNLPSSVAWRSIFASNIIRNILMGYSEEILSRRLTALIREFIAERSVRRIRIFLVVRSVRTSSPKYANCRPTIDNNPLLAPCL